MPKQPIKGKKSVKGWVITYQDGRLMSHDSGKMMAYETKRDAQQEYMDDDGKEAPIVPCTITYQP